MRDEAQVYASRLAQLASDCLIEEAVLTPKPGLVDLRGSGAHKDLSLPLMKISAQTLKPMFEKMALDSWRKPLDLDLRESIGKTGREAEALMLKATGGVNTHRGAIWTMGLLVSTSASIGGKCSENELAQRSAHLANLPDRFAKTFASHGSKVKAIYKVPGAKEEAQQGFPHVMDVALPSLRQARQKGKSEEHCRLDVLLTLMSSLSDTCVLYRAGWEGLKVTREGASAVLQAGGFGTEQGEAIFYSWEKKMLSQNISPGGSADLLAATLFVDRLSTVYEEQSEN